MPAIFPTDWTVYLKVLLILFRFMGIFMFMPIFSHRVLPVTVKVVLALTMSLALWVPLKPYMPELDLSVGAVAVAVIRETFLGLMMGFVANITFEAITMAVHFMGYQVGLGTAGLLDPQNHSQISSLVPLHSWVAIVLFLILDGHHEMLMLFVRSFEISALLHSDTFLNLAWLKSLIIVTAKLFWISVQMAAPFTLLAVCCNIAIGALARLLPQMNILMFSFPITLMLSLLGLYFIAPEIVIFMQEKFHQIPYEVSELIPKLK